jgi:hypothetical protein
VDPAPSLEAPLVFAGYGLSIPELGHDDFKDIDAKGKIVVYLQGAPPKVDGPLAAHSQSAGQRSGALRRAGAVGTIMIPDPNHMDLPWERMALARFLPAMALAEPALDDTQGLKAGVAFNPAHADKLLTGSGHSFDEIVRLAGKGSPLPHFDIPSVLKAEIGVIRADVSSQNVVALLPGTDPELRNEYLVMSAHIDHLGVGKPIKGDSIYNGAMDNASGVASLLDVAAIIKESGTRLRRSVLFVAVTAEEKGLLGSRFFAHHPPREHGKIVADINIDMILPIYPLKTLTMFGGEESDLGDDAAEVAKSLGVQPRPDPMPEHNIFIRSDQYSFVLRGIPSLMVMLGFEKGSPEEQMAMKWISERYHAPSDDLNQPVDKNAAGEFDDLVAKLLERTANRDARPRWKHTSFFKRLER